MKEGIRKNWNFKSINITLDELSNDKIRTVRLFNLYRMFLFGKDM